MTAPALRPYLPKDAADLAYLTEVSIEDLAAEDYSADQRAAWASFVADEAAFAKRLAAQLTLVVEGEVGLIGYGSLKDNHHIDLLFVHPDRARAGVASLICEALEKLAAARGAAVATTEASDTALPFFEQRGYVGRQRNTVMRNGEWLANTTMEKQLSAPAGAGRAS